MGASAARMAKRSGHAVSEGQDALRERPATGYWQPRTVANTTRPGSRRAPVRYHGSSIRPTICWAILMIISCCVLATERPYSGTSIEA